MSGLTALHDALASTLVPYGGEFRRAEAQLAEIEMEPGFVTSLLALLVEPSVDLGVKRAAAANLKNKVVRSWSPHQAKPISDADKALFKQQVIPAIVAVPPAITDFLLVCVTAILSYDFQHDLWPEFVPTIVDLLKVTDDFASVSAGLQLLKQLCKFYRWNTLEKNKQLAPLMEQTYPQALALAEAAVEQLPSENGQFYHLVYEVFKIYKLASSRYLPPVFRRQDIAQSTTMLFCRVFMLPWPRFVLEQQPDDRSSLTPVKCVKWAVTNILRTHNLYLTKSYAQLSENSQQYAPFRELALKSFSPEVTRLYIERLVKWSTESHGDGWLSDRALYAVVSYLDAMIEQKQVFTQQLEPQLSGLLGQVFYPLMAPTPEDFDEFENDPIEFVQRRVNFNDMMLTPGFAAAEFIKNLVKKRKNSLALVVQFLQQCTESASTNDVKSRVALFNLVKALAPSFLNKGSVLHSQLEPFMALYVGPSLTSPQAYLRYEACQTTTRLGSVQFEQRDTVQNLFQGVLACFFDRENLPVQVAAAQTLEALSLQTHNADIISSLGEHITEVVRNLLAIMSQIDLEALLAVLDHFVNQFPDQIQPFATDLAQQLTQQFIALASDLAEAQRQASADGGADNRVVDGELMMANDEKVSAGLGILMSLTNLQNNLEHQRELTVKLDATMAPVLLAVYQNELTDFYPDCMAMHENTLFTMKFVPAHHWQLFDLLLNIVAQTSLEYFDEAMPIFENYIVYGASGLVTSPDRLQRFVALIVNLYRPPTADEPHFDYGAPAAYAEAKTRSQVLSIAAKLLVSSQLFNGPLLTLIPQMVEAVLARVAFDQASASNSTASVPRYTVSIVSVILAAIYHEPCTTLTILNQTKASESFFQTWMASIKDFTRINDLKLALMTILSLLSYAAANPEFELPHLDALLSTLVHILEALPGAAARMAELMKQENENLWGDEDSLDDFETEYEDEDENDAGAEFDREVGSITDPGAENSIGDGPFMYENPGGTSSQTASADTATDEQAVSDLRAALNTSFVTDDFDEDIYSASPLDSLNAYDALRSVIYGMRDSQKSLYGQLLQTLPEHGKAVLEDSLQREDLPKYNFQ